MLEPRNTKAWTNIARMITAISSMIAIVYMFMRRYVKYQWTNKFMPRNHQQGLLHQYNEQIIGSPSNSMFPPYFKFEVLILCIFPIPYMDWYFSIEAKDLTCNYVYSELVIVAMLARLFFVFRAVFNYSVFSDAYSKKLCNQYGFYPTYDFTFRCYMAQDSLGTVFKMFVGSVMLLSYIIRLFERPSYRQLASDDVNYRALDSYFNANYWMVITMTTVGYGDITPGTWMGRATIIIACLVGSFIMAIFIG